MDIPKVRFVPVKNEPPWAWHIEWKVRTLNKCTFIICSDSWWWRDRRICRIPQYSNLRPKRWASAKKGKVSTIGPHVVNKLSIAWSGSRTTSTLQCMTINRHIRHKDLEKTIPVAKRSWWSHWGGKYLSLTDNWTDPSDNEGRSTAIKDSKYIFWRAFGPYVRVYSFRWASRLQEARSACPPHQSCRNSLSLWEEVFSHLIVPVEWFGFENIVTRDEMEPVEGSKAVT